VTRRPAAQRHGDTLRTGLSRPPASATARFAQSDITKTSRSCSTTAHPTPPMITQPEQRGLQEADPPPEGKGATTLPGALYS